MKYQKLNFWIPKKRLTSEDHQAGKREVQLDDDNIRKAMVDKNLEEISIWIKSFGREIGNFL